MSLSNIEIQMALKAAGQYAGLLDGKIGEKSQSAIQFILSSQYWELPKGWEGWPLQRKAIAAVQLFLKGSGHPEVGAIDGYAGMLTLFAFSMWLVERATGKPEPTWRPDDNPEPVVAGQKHDWGTQRDMVKLYGEAMGPQCTAGVVTSPFPLKVAWNLSQTVTTFRCHEKVADSATRALGRVAENYSPEEIEEWGFNIWSGCYAPRKKRGGSTLSMHAWGVAIDWDDTRNQLKWDHTQANFAQPGALPWFKIWEAEGWTSLGRARDFDWMHVQAPGL